MSAIDTSPERLRHHLEQLHACCLLVENNAVQDRILEAAGAFRDLIDEKERSLAELDKLGEGVAGLRADIRGLTKDVQDTIQHNKEFLHGLGLPGGVDAHGYADPTTVTPHGYCYENHPDGSGTLWRARAGGQPEVAAKYDAPSPFVFTYRNWRGEVATRRVQPLGIRYGATEWHPEPQWLLRALDLDKGEEREFAMNDIGGAPRPDAPAPDGLREAVAEFLKDRDEAFIVSEEQTDEERLDSADAIIALFAPHLAEIDRLKAEVVRLTLAADDNRQAAKEMEEMKDEALRAARDAEAHLAAAEARGREDEREACAQIADEQAAASRAERTGVNPTSVGPTGQVCLSIGGESTAKAIAAAIRSRKEAGRS